MIRRRPTVLLVDLDAIRHNVKAIRPPRAEFMAVVKADGYGHGAEPVGRAAVEAGAAWLGVALVEEGVRLRDAGLTAPVLVLTEFPPGSEKEALAVGLTPTLYTSEGVARVAEAASAMGGPIGAHVKVDTGMHRVGVPVADALVFVRSVLDAGLELEGFWTHFAKSEDLDDPFTEIQLRRFLDAADQLKAAGMRPRYLHAANSAAALGRPASHLDLVRVGLATYGLVPSPGIMVDADLRPAMSWRTAVTLVKRVAAGEAISYGLHYRLERESSIATVPVGYADGYRRRLGEGGAHVLIRGRRYPVAGAITMDQLMVDCGDDPVEAGDEVVLMGAQGDERITAEDLAGWMGTISYEVVCMVTERVPREYMSGSDVG
jgi:alanine racemase